MDQFLHPRRLGDLAVVAQRNVLGPTDRFAGDPQRGEDLSVEVLFAEEQLMDPAQELAALGPLDDAVVVRRGQRQDLRDSGPGDGVRCGPRPPLDTPSLPRRRWRPDPPSGGEPNAGCPGFPELVRLMVVPAKSATSRSPARTAHEVLVGGPELREIHCVGVLDAGHEQVGGCRRAWVGRWRGRRLTVS